MALNVIVLIMVRETFEKNNKCNNFEYKVHSFFQGFKYRLNPKPCFP